jgi:hypothetical protein
MLDGPGDNFLAAGGRVKRIHIQYGVFSLRNDLKIDCNTSQCTYGINMSE